MLILSLDGESNLQVATTAGGPISDALCLRRNLLPVADVAADWQSVGDALYFTDLQISQALTSSACVVSGQNVFL